MTLPASGTISLGQINTELGRSSTATISLDTAENGGYATINTCSPSYPLPGNPAAMSEWYSYNHNAVCVNSLYAMSDGGLSASQNMLYSNTKDYSTTVSTTRPSARGQFSISFWMENRGDSTQGYIYGIGDATSGDQISIGWSSSEDPNDPGVFLNFLFFTFANGAGGTVTSQVNISDNNNATNSGVSAAEYWGLSGNVGNVGTNGYALITLVVNYNDWTQDTYLQWYWNDVKLTCPWTSSGAYNISYTYGDSITTPDWTGGTMFIGGYVPTELSSGVKLDAFAIYTTNAISQSSIETIYGSPSVASEATYQGISTNLMYYNFEFDSPSIGEDTGGNYNMFLDEYNNPTKVADPAP